MKLLLVVTVLLTCVVLSTGWSKGNPSSCGHRKQVCGNNEVCEGSYRGHRCACGDSFMREILKNYIRDNKVTKAKRRSKGKKRRKHKRRSKQNEVTRIRSKQNEVTAESLEESPCVKDPNWCYSDSDCSNGQYCKQVRNRCSTSRYAYCERTAPTIVATPARGPLTTTPPSIGSCETSRDCPDDQSCRLKSVRSPQKTCVESKPKRDCEVMFNSEKKKYEILMCTTE